MAIEVAGKSDAINLIVEPVLPSSRKAAHYIVIFQDIEASKGASGARVADVMMELRGLFVATTPGGLSL